MKMYSLTCERKQAGTHAGFMYLAIRQTVEVLVIFGWVLYKIYHLDDLHLTHVN